MKYIDSEKLKAEIERLNSLVSYESKDRHDEGLHDAYKAIKNVITSLQQEQPIEGKQVIIITETDGDANIHWDCRSLDDVEALLKSAESFITEKHIDKMVGPRRRGPENTTIEDRYSRLFKRQQEQPLTTEKVVEQCKKFGGNPEIIQPEQKCIFGNTPNEDICSFCSAYCSLRVPKTKVSTSTEIATTSGQVENLTFEEYLRGVFEINNGIENDPDNLVRIHAPELLKLARKQEQPKQQNGKFVFPKYLYARTKDNKTIDMSYAPQDMTAVEYIRNDFVEQEKPKVDLEKEVDKFLDESGAPYLWCNDDEQKEWCDVIARHFYKLGLNARKEE